MIQVLAAAHQLTIEALVLLLMPDRQFNVCRAPQAPAALLAAAAELMPGGVTLLDPAFLMGSTAFIVKRLRVVAGQTRILICSSAPDDSSFATLMQAGATGYLGASATSAEVAKALQSVSQGKRYLNEALMAKISKREMIAPKAESEQNLPKRELEVFTLLVRGHSVSEIAIILRLSAKTVSTYKSRLMTRLNVCTLSELVCYAVSNKLPDPTQHGAAQAAPPHQSTAEDCLAG